MTRGAATVSVELEKLFAGAFGMSVGMVRFVEVHEVGY